jgi:hypothetical protein
MNVHSATCSCSVELYKLWYTLADFLPNWNFRGVFFTYTVINFAVRISAAAMARDIIFFSLAGPLGDYTLAHTVSRYTYECIFQAEALGFFTFFYMVK